MSFDDGENWQPLQNNMPHAPVYWIAVQEHFNDLVIATYGRGFWILDDELVSVETVHTRVEARDPSEVALYVRVFDLLKAAAHGGEAARALLTRAIEDWRRIDQS